MLNKWSATKMLVIKNYFLIQEFTYTWVWCCYQLLQFWYCDISPASDIHLVWDVGPYLPRFSGNERGLQNHS